jgi:hypothetical protein
MQLIDYRPWSYCKGLALQLLMPERSEACTTDSIGCLLFLISMSLATRPYNPITGSSDYEGFTYSASQQRPTD